MITIPNETAVWYGRSLAVRLPVEWCRAHGLVKGSPLYVVGGLSGEVIVSTEPMEWAADRRLVLVWRRPAVTVPKAIASTRGITDGSQIAIELQGASLVLRRVVD
jgi:antitoxin component of MazEF toxin-antitoxin module